ncbi:MAG TPA: amidohydrolase family protein, partial [Pyrinomonadaceae bacterium]|nr:amidohydrolase family protein [Pyrinomonadaceae bacterium]
MSKVPGNNRLLYNARLILPCEVIERGAIVIEDGSIAAIQTVAESLRYGGERVDLNGATVYPGFIDVHIHGAIGVDTMAASASDLNRVSLFLASRGVTGWLPTLVPAPSADYARAVGAIAEAADISGGARILGVHYEGPFVNSDQCGALRSQFFRSYSGNADVADLPILKPKSAKHMMTVAPEIDGGVALVADLTRHGWVVAVGHTRADFKVLDHAFAAGARHMTHFMNAMTPLHHRAPGPVGWGLLRPDVTC